MKPTSSLTLLAVAAFSLWSLPRSEAQSALDILRGIQPGQPAATTAPVNNQTQPTPVPAPVPAAVFDTRPAFMQTITNYTRVTNQVIVTNYVVVTNAYLVTNYYNAQGQFLQPVAPTIPGFVPIPATPAAAAAAVPDPKVVRANQVQGVKDLLSQAASAASSKLSPAGSFTNNSANQIPLPEGVTVFDRKRAQALSMAMNSAVERAVPQAIGVVQKSVEALNPPEPAQILQGDKEAATRYLLSTDGQNISNQMLAIIQRTSVDAGVPAAYQTAMLKGGGLLGAVLRTGPAVDMDAHLTKGLLEAIVKKMAAQEGVIRTTPAARTTKALQDAFK